MLDEVRDRDIRGWRAIVPVENNQRRAITITAARRASLVSSGAASVGDKEQVAAVAVLAWLAGADHSGAPAYQGPAGGDAAERPAGDGRAA